MLSAQQLAGITTTVASSLDVSVPRIRTLTVTKDTYGHSTNPTTTSTINVQVNLIKPSATQLSLYASIIGTQRALVMRAMQTTDIKEGDMMVHDGLNWLVNNVQDADSYTVTREFLITVVT